MEKIVKLENKMQDSKREKLKKRLREHKCKYDYTMRIEMVEEDLLDFIVSEILRGNGKENINNAGDKSNELLNKLSGEVK